MHTILFAHGDPFTLLVALILKSLNGLADDAAPLVVAAFKLVCVLVVLPIVVLVTDFVCGVVTAIVVRKKIWLLLLVSGEALVLYIVFCSPAAAELLSDWPAFWGWLTIGVGGLISLLMGLLNGTLLVALIVLLSRRSRTKTEIGGQH